MARALVAASSQSIETAISLPNYTSTLSIGAWVFVTVAPSGTFPAIFSKGPSGTGTGRNFQLEWRDFFGTYLDFSWWGASSNVERYFAATPTLNRWYHVVCTADWTTNPDTIAMYLGGVAQTLSVSGSTNDGANPSGTQLTRMGRGHIGSDYWNGRLAEVFATSAVLTASQALALASGMLPTALGVTLDGYWPLWGTHSPEIDLTSNGRTGTVTGATAAAHAPVVPFSRRFWGLTAPLLEEPPPDPPAAAIGQRVGGLRYG